MTERPTQGGSRAVGRFVRPYALTGGRTRSERSNLSLETLILSNASGSAAAPDLPPERRQVIQLCAEAISVAELSALLNVPIGVARVLASDMHADGYLDAHEPMPEGTDLAAVLERVLDGLRVL